MDVKHYNSETASTNYKICNFGFIWIDENKSQKPWN